MSNTAVGAEINIGFGSAGNEQKWNVKYFGYLEIFRDNSRKYPWAIGVLLQHELVANPNNSISFLMRGSIWNETLVLFKDFKKFEVSLGFTHHCRHEIDNSIPADETKPKPIDFIPSRRLIVNTSEHLTFTSKEIFLAKNLTARFLVRTDIFTYFVDGREGPDRTQEQSWDYLRASNLLGARLNVNLGENCSIYSRNWLNILYFTKKYDHTIKPVGSNARAEIGFSGKGIKGNFEFFGAYEKFFDDVSRPFRQPSEVFIIGMRGRGKLFF
ncbi:MAG: hypothetical protein H7Y04_13810 [Verrucomicrobia bacterium]|nr:hypothetical protein [Cytophagales bacterium]